MEKRSTAKNVDEYLQQFPETQQATLAKVRKAILQAAPKAKEVISYQIPMYKLNGTIAAFAGFKNHCSFFPTSHAIMAAFKEELELYDTKGVTIHFPVDKPLPSALIKKMVAAKINENEVRQKKKENKLPRKQE